MGEGERIRKWKKPQEPTEKTEDRNGFDGFAVGEFLRFSQNIRVEYRYLSVEQGKQVITTRAVSFVLGTVSFYGRARGDDGGAETYASVCRRKRNSNLPAKNGSALLTTDTTTVVGYDRYTVIAASRSYDHGVNYRFRRFDDPGERFS